MSDQNGRGSTWEKLAAPFNDADLADLREGRDHWRHVVASACRTRIESVLGHASWQTHITYADGVAAVQLSLDVAGETTKRGAIGYEYDELNAEDAAFIRACEAFGIGRYLALSDARWARPRSSAAAPARDPEPAPRDDRRDDEPSTRHTPPATRGDDRRDDRPARDERRHDDRDRDRDRDRGDSRNGGSRREYGDHGRRTEQRNGGGWGQGPRPGGHAYKWLKDLEETHARGEGLSKHVGRWMKDHGLGFKISELSEHELFEVVDVVNEYLGETSGARR